MHQTIFVGIKQKKCSKLSWFSKICWWGPHLKTQGYHQILIIVVSLRARVLDSACERKPWEVFREVVLTTTLNALPLSHENKHLNCSQYEQLTNENEPYCDKTKLRGDHENLALHPVILRCSIDTQV